MKYSLKFFWREDSNQKHSNLYCLVSTPVISNKLPRKGEMIYLGDEYFHICDFEKYASSIFKVAYSLIIFNKDNKEDQLSVEVVLESTNL